MKIKHCYFNASIIITYIRPDIDDSEEVYQRTFTYAFSTAEEAKLYADTIRDKYFTGKKFVIFVDTLISPMHITKDEFEEANRQNKTFNSISFDENWQPDIV